MINASTLAPAMDDDVREAIHAKIAPCSSDEFLEAYIAAHMEKYGEPWMYANVLK